MNSGGTRQVTLEQALDIVKAANADGRFDEALTILRSIMPHAPRDPRVFLAAADAAAGAGSEEAYAWRERATMLCFAVGRQRLSAGDAAGASRALRKAVAVWPDAPFNYHFEGEAQLAADKFAQAAPAYTRALRIFTDDYASAHRLLDVFSLLGRWDLVAAALPRLEALFPNAPQFMFLKAVCGRAYEKYDAAARDLGRAVVLQGWRAPFHREYGHILKQHGRFAEAAAAYEAAAEHEADRQDLLSNLALCAGYAGRNPASLTVNQAAAAQRKEEARRARDAGDPIGAFEALNAASITLPFDAALYAEAEAACGDALRFLAADPADVGRRSPQWLKIQCRAAEQRYWNVVAANPQWSGPPGPPPAAARRPLVWDAFMFYNELDMLELRLNELSDVVDRFVLSESPWTHQGAAKPLHFQENRARFAAFADRITYVSADRRLGLLPWDQEYYQRECLADGLAEAAEDDMLLLCDVDEVPRAENLRALLNAPAVRTRLTGLSMVNFNYFINFASLQPFIRPVLLPVAMARALGLNGARYVTCRGGPQIVPTAQNAGWHFSWLGGVETVWRKLQSFCHVELLGPVRTKEQLREKLESGDFQILKGAIDGGFVPVDGSFPRFVRDDLAGMKARGWLFEPKTAPARPAPAENHTA